ncbi:hypothetical protein [Methylocystis rosea]|uniref:hypothetical protein n=1 Tax=Methylocystis rosea TaxID=173366 RepID=UPI000372D461|nr:hypothetical protein [Methylocystis rosea]
MIKNLVLLKIAAPFVELFQFIGDHRYSALAALALTGAVAARNVPIAGAALSKALFALAIGFACFDGGYSYRAAIDREAWNQAEAARLAVELAEHARREAAIAKARNAAGAEARAQAALEADREKILKESDHASRENDRSACLPASSVMRLNRIR